MAKKWLVGCSGFYYKDWKEVFYPKGLAQKDWFPYYCQHFNTLELNVTFYRFPELKMLRNWYTKAPDRFVFAAKVPREVTHTKKFIGTADELKSFYDILVNGLEEKLGPVLFQLPPSLAYSEEKLQAIIDQIDPSFNNVIEFRHISWWRKEVMAALGKHNVTFCGVSYPGLIDDVVVNTARPYYRFHGVPKLYYSSYDDAFLTNVVEQINSFEKVEEAFLFFNNTAAAAALDNARLVQGLVAKKKK